MDQQEHKPVAVGDAVIWTDSLGVPHPAIVTAVWGEDKPGMNRPSINLVTVSPDETKTDQYGRQIERQTSVVHRNGQPAHGWYWKSIGE